MRPYRDGALPHRGSSGGEKYATGYYKTRECPWENCKLINKLAYCAHFAPKIKSLAPSEAEIWICWENDPLNSGLACCLL